MEGSRDPQARQVTGKLSRSSVNIIGWLIEKDQCLSVVRVLRPLLAVTPFSRVILVPRAFLAPLVRMEIG